MRIGLVARLVRALERAMVAVCLWGRTGIGKSELVAQMCAEDEVRLVDIRLSQLNPVDLRGLPRFDGCSTRWAPPSFLVHEGRVRYFLDEANLAASSVQAAAYELVLDNRIGEHALDRTVEDGRPRQTVILAGNIAALDWAAIHEMAPPLRNRMWHVVVEPHLADFRRFAIEAGMHPLVTGFVSFTARVGVGLNDGSPLGLLWWFDPKIHKQAFPTPRSWHQVSRLLHLDPNYAEDAEAISGAIGEAAAVKFAAYAKVDRELPDATDVLHGNLRTKPPKTPDATYAFCGALSGALVATEKTDRAAAARHVAAYCVEHFGRAAEFAMLTLHDFAQTKQGREVLEELVPSPEWQRFTKVFGELAR